MGNARAPKSRPLVLVIDDGKQHVMLLKLALMQRGYAVVVVHSVEGACTMLRERSVNALLVTTPLEAAAEALRAIGSARPSVAMATAPDGPDGQARVHAAGFDFALPRPIDFAELDALLRDHMSRRTSGVRARVRTPRGNKQRLA
ncbi:hypothetical protein AKJ09_11177 [Labilithrix luteola]|uniref:Response regulatory domain-containing protein n=1 Tax=Labilithrix luteola TaxID=1391654 RepID=A0A0K1QFH5_9BACT|nr:response regulator [Labilithrix luteola]AKV04514.1 hypothetical protein AKJ09_11177 [Labilithrix luteola]